MPMASPEMLATARDVVPASSAPASKPIVVPPERDIPGARSLALDTRIVFLSKESSVPFVRLMELAKIKEPLEIEAMTALVPPPAIVMPGER